MTDLAAIGLKAVGSGAAGFAAGGPIGGLVGVAAAVVPEIVRAIEGDKSGETAERIAAVVEQSVGTKDSIDAISVIANNPAVAADLKVKLLEIHAAMIREQNARELAEHQAVLADRADARKLQTDLVKSGSKLSIGPAMISAVVMMLFGYVVIAPGFGVEIAENSSRLVEYAQIAVLSYWVGSSRGSAAKQSVMDEMVSNKAPDASQAQKVAATVASAVPQIRSILGR